uniref:Uncharacterized protein n=1 Tax=Anguilla anguilla TaxID=7936 RepID=A0A0E9U361_ANGAN
MVVGNITFPPTSPVKGPGGRT